MQGNGDDGNKEDLNVVRDNAYCVTAGDGGGDGMTDLNVDSNVSEVLPEKAVDLPNGGDGELMVCEVCNFYAFLTFCSVFKQVFKIS